MNIEGFLRRSALLGSDSKTKFLPHHLLFQRP